MQLYYKPLSTLTARVVQPTSARSWAPVATSCTAQACHGPNERDYLETLVLGLKYISEVQTQTTATGNQTTFPISFPDKVAYSLVTSCPFRIMHRMLFCSVYIASLYNYKWTLMTVGDCVNRTFSRSLHGNRIESVRSTIPNERRISDPVR